jgi:hypothetical protein
MGGKIFFCVELSMGKRCFQPMCRDNDVSRGKMLSQMGFIYITISLLVKYNEGITNKMDNMLRHTLAHAMHILNIWRENSENRKQLYSYDSLFSIMVKSLQNPTTINQECF